MGNTVLVISKDESDRLVQYLQWWVERTQEEKHMLAVSPESLLNEFLVAVVILDEYGNIIAASAIVHARNKEKSEIFHEGRKVVELGSNVVGHKWRNKGLGKILVLERLAICKSNSWFPVSVTTNPAVHTIFQKLEATPMDNENDYTDLRNQLCLCETVCDTCTMCPLQHHGGWVFPAFVS